MQNSFSAAGMMEKDIIERMERRMEIKAAGKKRQVIIEYKRIRNMWMRMGENGSLKISCSRSVTDRQIREFILSREKWIMKAEESAGNRVETCSYGSEGNDAVWLGKHLPVHVEPSSKDFMTIDENGLTYYLRTDTDENRRKLFYKEAARQIMYMIKDRRDDLDREICEANSRPLPKITIKYMTSRWGSCTPLKAHISISVRLIHFPPVCLDYVLLHEYAHMLEANHSKSFWSIVASYMPEYKDAEKLLKQ